MGDVILLRKCLLCRRSCIHGLAIRGHTICAACESRLVNLACDDPAYDSLRLGLKKIYPRLVRRWGPEEPTDAPERHVARLYRAW